MATSFQQTDTAAGATNVQCSGNTNNTGDTESNQAQDGGTAGVTELTITMDANAADLNAVWMEIVNIDNYDGASGTWTWRINCTTGNNSIVLTEVHICHVSSAYAAKNTLGSDTTLGTKTGDGNLSGTITQSGSVTIDPGDLIIVIYAFDNNTGGSMTGDFGYTPNQIISAPGTITNPVSYHLAVNPLLLPY